MTRDKIQQIYESLFKRFGPQFWWPGETKDEIIVGAILTQNTNWQNVEKAIANLKQASVMSLEKLHDLPQDEIAELIRPAGYYNIKAKRLKNFLNWLFETHNGSLEEIQAMRTDSLREELLSVNGVGRETADSILLYALEKPVFVVDAYTYRIATRHHLIEPECDYEQLRSLFEDNLETDVKLFNEYHALIVYAGKEFCRPRPKCSGCPLECLPHEIIDHE
ncbi:MAG: endonuclease [Planctomycetes bacterium GWF2_42_9]|nr:MAG: endonuclease [Planctomycetes bacterium GWF2_42_9]HAL45069.1 endonuclease [Phycisphaerales bacterium]